MTRPLLALTMGDPAGIGPETVVGIWNLPHLHEVCRPLIVGRPEIVERAARLRRITAKIIPVDDPAEALPAVDAIPVLTAGGPEAVETPPAKIDPRGGQAAYDALRKAAELAIAGRIDGLVTGPLHKAALNAAGHDFPGHTEMLGTFCGVAHPAMMLYLPPTAGVEGTNGLGVVHTTLHVSLRDALDALSTERIVAACELADEMLGRLSLATVDDGEPRPRARIGVCALNPHAGEEGLFGGEEQQVILPAVQEARRRGIDAFGPFPTDTLMVRARAGEFDGVVAMYHDQGHIALKLLGMHRAVNITCGLPIVRTSVAHGTAFELAWQGRAETSGMIEAIQVAARLCRTHPRSLESTGADRVF